MILFRGLPPLNTFERGAVVTIGNFDGVHLGHQQLIKLLKVQAERLKLPLVLILFEPQASEYFQGAGAPARLCSLREKLQVLKQCQVEMVCCIRFNAQLAQMSAFDFAQNYLFSSFNMKYLLIGADFRFGKNREGDPTLLQALGKQHNCEVQVYQDFCIGQERVSSTKIRAALKENKLELAAKYLGRTYSLCGRVVRGAGRGREWGIPTANLGLKRLSLPLRGVFVVQVLWRTRLIYGVANMGTRPTVDGTKNVLEIHLFDFQASIYGELVQVFFLHQLRDEVKFNSLDSLIAQIHQDIAQAKVFLNLNPCHRVNTDG